MKTGLGALCAIVVGLAAPSASAGVIFCQTFNHMTVCREGYPPPPQPPTDKECAEAMAYKCSAIDYRRGKCSDYRLVWWKQECAAKK